MKPRTCEQCGRLLAPVARFCPHCGRPVRPVARGGCGGRLLLLVLAALAVAFSFRLCHRVRHIPVEPAAEVLEAPDVISGAIDLSTLPHALLDRDIVSSRLRLRGLGIGDPDWRIPHSQRLYTSGAYIQLRDGNRFHVNRGTIDQIIIEDPSLLDQLQLIRNDAVRRLGEPDQSNLNTVPPGRSLQDEYVYARRGLSFRFDDRTGRIVRVIVQPPRR